MDNLALIFGVHLFILIFIFASLHFMFEVVAKHGATALETT